MTLFERVYAKSISPEVDGKKLSPLRDVMKFANSFFKQNLLNKTIETKDGRKVQITERGFNELFFSISEALKGGDKAAAKIFRDEAESNGETLTEYTYDVLSMVVSLEDIIKDMKFEKIKPNYKPDRKPDVKSYAECSCEVIIEGEPKECKVKIEIPYEGEKRYYFHYVD